MNTVICPRPLLFLLVTICLGSAGLQSLLAGDAPPIKRAGTLPATTPWDLDALSQSPVFDWSQGKEIRSLFYKGVPYQGKPTRVFACCATPGSLAGDPSLDKALPGISWGGCLACSVAGLDNRFKAAVPVSRCGFLHGNSAWLKTLESMSPKDRETWVQLWDPSMHVGSAMMPMLFVNGGTDFAYPPDSHAGTFALVTAPKCLHFVPHLPHGHIFDNPEAVEVFIDRHLKVGLPLPTIGPVEVGEKHHPFPIRR